MGKRTLTDTSKDPLAKEKFVQEGQKKGKAKSTALDMIKVTYYISRDQVIALDRIRAKRLQAGASLREVDKSTLLREAIDLLVKQEKV